MMTKEREDVRLMKSTAEIWADVLELVRPNVTEPMFNTWIRQGVLKSVENDEATIAYVNEFGRNYVCTRFQKVFEEAFATATHADIRVKIVVDPSVASSKYEPSIANITVIPQGEAQEALNLSNALLSASSETGSPSSPSAGGVSTNSANFPPRNPAYSTQPINQSAASKSNLNPKYTFETFVVGSNNRFCHSAALAVAQRPGQAYNPLFVYGGVGLGKTHLMQAIGHEILRNSPNTNVKYITCERFTNELINSIRDDRMADFKKRYRQIDVLLMDDIQFIAGKESTQEEFFHTFNALRDANRQIVLSSDRAPKAISTLEERLKSRFEWGLITDVQAPDLETRMAILHKKCELDGLSVKAELIEIIASMFTNNIRELEGALIRAHAYTSLTGAELNSRDLIALLKPEAATEPKKQITLELILDTVAEAYRVEPSELRSAKRSQDLALPRHIAMYLAHELIQMSFPRIGTAFGNRKHTSAIYAYDKIKTAIESESDLSDAIRKIRHKLGV
ncbi:MAG: chromosomal replication initiator protein DnaA [Candidatus Melainabacteria bacterium]|jgi:chromosomal replication initiator protein|nr:chromosomal replication initiator protein DnaA [Candidatus Melainabacteria bacterium]